MRILVSALMMLKEWDRFNLLLTELGLTPVPASPTQFLRESELLPIIAEFDGMIAGDDELTSKVLNAGVPRLKVISKWGTGVDSIDLEAARTLGIHVLNSPGAFADAVGEAAIAYILALERKIIETDRLVRSGHWPKETVQGLPGKTLGLIGCGAIGQGIGSRATSMGMDVIGYDPYLADANRPSYLKLVSLDDIFLMYDYVALACNLTSENRHIINYRALEKMKASACVVNVARGPLVQESALVNAITSGQIAGAALDVLEHEPLPDDSPLCKLESVILGSHNANNVVAANEYVHQNTIGNLLSVLKS